MNDIGFWWALKGEHYLRDFTRELLLNIALIVVVVTTAIIVPVKSRYNTLYLNWYKSDVIIMDITAPLVGWNPTTCEDYRYMIRYTDDIIELHRIQVRIVDEIILLERLRTLVSDTSSWAQFIVEREVVLIQLETANTTRTGLTKKFRAKCTEVA